MPAASLVRAEPDIPCGWAGAQSEAAWTAILNADVPQGPAGMGAPSATATKTALRWS